MSGIPSALHQAFAAVRMGGRVQLLGIPKGEVPVDFAAEIIFKGITVYGVIGRKMYDTWHQMRRYLTAGLLDPRPVITHQFPLTQVEQTGDRKSTRLNSSHGYISYAVFCLKKKKKQTIEVAIIDSIT